MGFLLLSKKKKKKKKDKIQHILSGMKFLVNNNMTLFSNKLFILSNSRFYRSFAEKLQRKHRVPIYSSLRFPWCYPLTQPWFNSWNVEVEVTQLCPTLHDPEFFRPEHESGSLLQRIFPTQGWNPGLLHCRWILYQLSHKGSPRILEWVAYPFSRFNSYS